jgi:hypothetical protein
MPALTESVSSSARSSTVQTVAAITPSSRQRICLSIARSSFARLPTAFAPYRGQIISPISVPPFNVFRPLYTMPPSMNLLLPLVPPLFKPCRNYTVPPSKNMSLYCPFLLCSTRCRLCTLPPLKNLSDICSFFACMPSLPPSHHRSYPPSFALAPLPTALLPTHHLKQ